MRILLDTNVLVAAFTAQRVLEDKLRAPTRQVTETIAFVSEYAEVVAPIAPATWPERDPDDQWVAAAALDGTADILVTGDKDLLDAGHTLQFDSSNRLSYSQLTPNHQKETAHMDNQQTQPPATPEEIRATLDRITEEQEKSSGGAKRRDKKAKRQMEELREQMKDTDRRLKKTDELFNSQWGKLVEGDLVPSLQERGIEVQSTHRRVDGRRNGDHYEFDILAINGEEVVVVEVRTTWRSGDMTHFLGKLTRFTKYEPVWKGKKIFGAVAYLEADTSVQVYAQRQGLFVIRATGSSAGIINHADFRPRVFS